MGETTSVAAPAATGLDLASVKDLVIMPALQTLGLMSPAALNLVTGTGLVESGYIWLKQTGGGPALGPWQMEPATEQDIWGNWLKYQPGYEGMVRKLLVPGPTTSQLVWNLQYAAAMCRIKYLRAEPPLPAYDDAEGLATYWKNFYNTALGAGSVDAGHIASFKRAIEA